MLTFLLELITLLYNNGLFAGNGTPRAIVSFSAMESKEGLVANAVHIRVLLPRRVKVQAGQYINLWMPSVSLCSCALLKTSVGLEIEIWSTHEAIMTRLVHVLDKAKVRKI